MYWVDGIREQTDSDGDHASDEEEEDGKVEVVEVFDDWRSVVRFT